jgi:ribonuclease Z
MVLAGKERMVLIDSGCNPILRLEQAGLDFNDLTDIVLTHFHPDHASGIPLLLMDMWLLGRETPLHIYGLHYTLDRLEGLMGFYNWSDWPNFFPVIFHRLPIKEMTPVLDCPDFTIYASPVRHFIPNIGLRVEFAQSRKVMAYSCDTEPCDEVVRLSEKADVLIHEATGETPGHSSARQAGEVAKKANVGRLYLIHYPTGRFAGGNLVAEAHTTFSGNVSLMKDFMVLKFGKRLPLSHFGRGAKTRVYGKKTGKIYHPEI